MPDDVSMTHRVPMLDGALNFRDLGGYRTDDGRSVRWNRVYRSGTTHALTAADLAWLDAQGVRHAYDLRSNEERRDQPNRLRDIAALDYHYLDHDRLPGDIRRLLKSPGVRAEQAHQLMIGFYQKLPHEFEQAYRALFQLLANGKVPLVFSCTAGKDRTGGAAALLLTALGVPWETVLKDYLLTEQFFDRSCDLILTQGGIAWLNSIDRDVWEPLMRVHPAYLEAMFDGLRTSHGSVDRYLHEQLGIDRAGLDRMRTRLLE